MTREKARADKKAKNFTRYNDIVEIGTDEYSVRTKRSGKEKFYITKRGDEFGVFAEDDQKYFKTIEDAIPWMANYTPMPRW